MNPAVDTDATNLAHPNTATNDGDRSVAPLGASRGPEANGEGKLGFINRICRRAFFGALAKNEVGALQVFLPDGAVHRLGDTGATAESAVLRVKDWDFFRRAVLYGDIGFGESYMADEWDSPDIRAVLQWFMQNARSTPTFSGAAAKRLLFAPLEILDRVGYLLRPNTKKMSRKNISEHYDLSNDFFRLWLDETMAYSSGIFARPDSTLHEAQLEKFERMADKLQLGPEDRVLEIGCGWGGFAVFAAKTYGCRVTGITISQEQFDVAVARAKEAGVDHLVEIVFRDYRDVEGSFDKIVSIEMVEALGYKYFDTFFTRCNELLKPDGIMVIQCITFPDPYYGTYLKTTDFTKKHIFPGSLLLSLREILQSLHRTGNLVIYQSESIGQHYALTLREWRLNFERSLDQVRELGFDEVFIRKWRYYLLFCETGFANNYINDLQIQFARPQSAALKNYLPGLKQSA
ncbi:MAG: cyclopropane-fatty-acyl-phospholipid synthase family protein [bacterium]|nr:cyclopropane-fatty-acyl-phospholipid synthase family protein [bacterium]